MDPKTFGYDVTVRPNAYAYSWRLEKKNLFPESIFIIKSGEMFRIILCFCVRISFIPLLIKWSREMEPNVKPQTLVETFDQANSNSIPECWLILC